MTANRYQVTLAPVRSGWTFSTVALTIGGYTTTYYHSDTTSAVEVWYELASQATNQLGYEVVPFVYDDSATIQNRLVFQASQAFSINIGSSAGATKLGHNTSGVVTATLVDGKYELVLTPGAYQYGFTVAPKYAEIDGFQTGFSGGSSSADGDYALPSIAKSGSVNVKVLERFVTTYQWLESWENEGTQAYYDIAVGQNKMFRGAIESVKMDRTGAANTYIMLNIQFRAVGL
tara:strand:+ start:19292 stop:19987 length:696 start_codon:yes stop_codon:yes gene_type:complete